MGNGDITGYPLQVQAQIRKRNIGVFKAPLDHHGFKDGKICE